MATYEFWIIPTAYITYDGVALDFTVDPSYDPSIHNYRVVITDDDATLDGYAAGLPTDANQTAVIYDNAGNVVDSGPVYSEAYADLTDSAGDPLTIDRINIDGIHYGYSATEPLSACEVYDLVSSSTKEETLSYFENNGFACFCPGTLILTNEGELPVEWLASGMEVETKEHGLQPIVWTGRMASPAGDALQEARLVEIPEDAFGPGQPGRTLLVSPQHRILLSEPLCELYFGRPDVYVAAKHLLGWRGVRAVPPKEDLVLYHLAVAQHASILVEGLFTESLFLTARSHFDVDPRDQKRLSAAIKRFGLHRQTAHVCLKALEVPLVLPHDESGRDARRSA